MKTYHIKTKITKLDTLRGLGYSIINTFLDIVICGLIALVLILMLRYALAKSDARYCSKYSNAKYCQEGGIK